MKTLSVRARIGLWLSVLLAVVDVAGAFVPSAPDGQGPPLFIMIFSAVMGVITLVAAVVVGRSGSRSGLRITAVSRILSGLTAVPAFFLPGVTPLFVAWGAATVVLTVVAVVMLMDRARTSGPSRTADRVA